MKSMITKGILFLALIDFILGSPIEFNQLDEPIVPNVVEDLNYRLPQDVIAKNYKITLEPFFEDEGENRAFTFKGNVEITLEALENVNQVVLHFNDMEILSYSFPLSQNLPYNASQYNSQYDKWTIPIPQSLNNGVFAKNQTTTLSVSYKANMRDDMRGFYKSYYIEGGKKVWMGTTQFQPVHARRAFPSFDEPGFKATFDLIMIRPKTLALTLGNSRLKNTAIDDDLYPGRFIDTFETTPEMSTYLLAFIVSNYVGSLKNTDNFGVYARPEAKPHTDYSVEFGIKMLNAFNEYFGIDYYDSIPKMDMAAIPDFSAGAMENWGLLTYRETGILYDPETTPDLNQQRIAAVIAHEQLHQWFGDLVTCKWWSETWMNEGFARYFQFMGTAMIEKEWDLEEQFVVENLQQSMQLDSTDSTHPMTNVVNTKSEASAIFDNISYNKAASIIRMLSYYVGSNVFQGILRKHLSDNKYKAVIPDDFFNAIEAVKDAPTAEFFKSWTIQSGFPVVNASINGTTLKLTQQRFMRNGIAHNKTEMYNIPISIAMDNTGFDDPSYKFVIDNNSYDHILTTEPKSYYMLNVQQTAFYRVNYVDDNWDKIKDVLMGTDREKIHVLNRAQVVDDLLNLARGGVVTYSKAVDIVRYLKNETHYIPWLSAINNGFTFLSQRVKNDDADIFAWFINDLMENIYKKLTFNEKSDDRRTDIYNRVNILTWMCKYGYEECISESKKAFEDYVISYKKVPKNQRSLVYCNAIRYGGDEEFNFLFDKLLVENVAAEQLNIMNALACSKNEKNIKRLLGRLIRTNDIRIQDRSAVINAVINSNIEGVDFIYNFVTSNYADWKTTNGDLSTLTTIVGRFTNEDQLEKFESFLEAEKDGLGDLHASLSNAVNTAKSNLEWDDKYMKEFINHLYEISSASNKVISMITGVFTLFTLYYLN